MIPWEVLDRTVVPEGEEPLVLARRGHEYVIRLGTRALMASGAHESEEQLATLACERIASRPAPHVLIGGLGMGFTLAAALRVLPAGARVTVAELLPAVVAWNRGPLAPLAGRPLEDPRVDVFEDDVADALRSADARYDAILLDVDNGPDGLTREGNDWLYDMHGLRAAHRALTRGGVLAVWSVAPDARFTQRLIHAGLRTECLAVRARRGKGGRHTLWLAER